MGRSRPLACWAAALLLATTVAVGGCVSPIVGAIADAPGRAQRVELMHAPFHAQAAFRCGPAALATALGGIGLVVSPDRLADDVFLPARQGSLQAEMLAGARRHGAVATRIEPSIDGLLRELATGHPVVILQNLGLAMAPAWHYAVVIGYDLEAAEVILHSGSVPNLRLSLRTFKHTWARSERWGFVVQRPGDWPVTASVDAVVEAATGFERVALPADAVRAYSSAVQRWPDSLPLAAGLGNALYATGDLAGAALWFRKAATQHDSPAAWINLSTTLWAMGDLRGALGAARQALDAASPVWRQAAEAAWAAIVATLPVDDAARLLTQP